MKKNIHIILVFQVILLVTALTHDLWKSHDYAKSPFQFTQDINQYYSYLPATFVDHDPSFQAYTMSDLSEKGYWLIENQNGVLLPKVTLGMTYMYAPFFFIAHAIAPMLGAAQNGYSAPYSTCIMIGTLLYFFIGLWYLIKALDFYFNKWVSALTALLLFFGTNLFFYVLGAGEMPHSYLFSVYSIMIYLTILWHQKKKKKYLYFLGFLFGMVVIIRQIEVVSMLFFLLFGVYNKKTLQYKIELIKNNYPAFIKAFFFFLLPIIPQLIYWRIYGGSWLVYSYGNAESFFFLDPKIIEFVFGYRKGWLLYSPMMVLAILGFYSMYKKEKDMFFGVSLLTILMIYILSSWWCWWYGGSFGMRAMIQYYAFLAFPLASFCSMLFKKKHVLILVFPFVLFSLYYNILYSYKYQHWSLHWDGLNKDAYWYTFLKHGTFPGEEQAIFESYISRPDYQAAQKGIR